MEVDLNKDLYKIGTKDGILNSLHPRNQFTTCAKGTVSISDVLLKDCVGKASLFDDHGI